MFFRIYVGLPEDSLRIGCKRAVQNITEIHVKQSRPWHQIYTIQSGGIFVLKPVLQSQAILGRASPIVFFWVKSTEFVWKSPPPQKNQVQSSSLSPLFHHVLSCFHGNSLGDPRRLRPVLWLWARDAEDTHGSRCDGSAANTSAAWSMMEVSSKKHGIHRGV